MTGRQLGNETRSVFPTGESIYSLLQIQAVRTPDASAIATPGRDTLTLGRPCSQIEVFGGIQI